MKLPTSEDSFKMEEKTPLQVLLEPFGPGRQAIPSFYLGTLFGVGFCLVFTRSKYYDLGLFFIALAFFHMWEYLYVSMYWPETLNISSFLIDHSNAFLIALFGSLLEYFLEKFFLPNFKGSPYIVYPAFCIVVIGQVIRTISMLQCGKNFNHRIEFTDRKEHELVTFGLYKYFRHPSYFGWFYWSVFTQVLLMNPISIIGFSVAAWLFFSGRIQVEEYTLLQKFGKKYYEFKRNTRVWIPFIK